MKRGTIIILTTLILGGCLVGLTAAGSREDPLIPLSYLNNSYLPNITKKISEKVDTAAQAAYQIVLNRMSEKQQDYLSQMGGRTAGEADEVIPSDRRVKWGDVITLPTGADIMLLAGSSVASYSSGAVIDLTTGKMVSSGEALTVNHRYLAAENTRAQISITSDTAVIRIGGDGAILPGTGTDYNAIADALYTLGIFRGTGTGYGSGYDLERQPTRIEGLVMFLRLTGEEQAALSYTGAHPFSDVPAWCQTYVAYAYHKGYTKGVGSNQKGQLLFGTDSKLGAPEYLTFLLRALGYNDSGSMPDFTWENAVSMSRNIGMITEGEYEFFLEWPFLRAQVAYLSYFALDTNRKDSGGTLLESLIAAGTLNAAEAAAVRGGVTVTRIGSN